MREIRPTEIIAELPGGAVDATRGIGDRLKTSGDELRQCGQTLSAFVEPAGQTLIREAVDTLNSQSFRLVVVGQIKSGKSSFINALVGQPYLLPTDVTPWTTAVTNLHFAKEAPGNYGAQFHFFSESEWQELALGGGPIRELTQRLVPGFDAETLRHQVEALKQRASTRLGHEFADLLGGSHYFEHADRNLLLHYVCSGDFSGDERLPALGKYADVTKQADLYLRSGPFAFPVTVTDTPGTNDPFLIRDEITRRSLKSADLFIVVLSARQPLSDSDLSLLRLMHGLNKDRIIAFVNRIDDFADVSYDLAEVLIYVEKKLQAEFPGASIPVIAGSAAWANCAYAANDELFAHILQRSSCGYLAELGLIADDDCTLGALSDPLRRERLSNALVTASGLPAIYSAIAERTGASEAARSQLQVARCFSEMARASASSMRAELEAVKNGHGTAQVGAEKRAELERQARTLDEVADNVNRSGRHIEHQLLRILDEEMQALRSGLTAAVDRHAATEREVLIDALRRQRMPRAWTHEGVELRRALADVFAKSFDRALSRVVAFQAKVAPELHRLMGIVAPDMARPAEPDPGVIDVAVPNVAALSRFVCLDLDGSWWSGFWKRRNSPTVYGDQIQALIKSEFQLVVDELVQTAQAALQAYVTKTTRWSFGLCLNIVQGVQRRREEMSAHGGAVVAAATEDAKAEHEQKLKWLNDGLLQCQGLHRQLGAICSELAAGLQSRQGTPS